MSGTCSRCREESAYARTYIHAYIHTYIPTYLPTYIHTYRYIDDNIGIRIYIEIHMIVSLNKGTQYVPPKRVPEFWKLPYIHVQVWDYCSELFQGLLSLRNSEPSRRYEVSVNS